ncbi:MAG TPA: EamA family transporter [Rhizomicrobium sp.]|nr:EamA family transporter [Rhizomicrobium sp.]
MTNSFWVLFTIVAAMGQTARNAMQRDLTPRLGAAGATQVRFLFGFPFALIFLIGVTLWTRAPLPQFSTGFDLWTILGAVTQVGGTALMLLTMERRSFVVTIAYLKTEPVLVALFGFLFLGDIVTWPMAGAIGVAMAGVMLLSLKPGSDLLTPGWRPAALGLAAASLFGLSSIAYRGAILALNNDMGGGNYVMGATFSLTCGLLLQTVILWPYLIVKRRDTLKAILRLWRPSLMAGLAGAAASEFWFLAFALATAASVRTLALIEIVFAQGVSRFVFKNKTTPRETVGIAVLIAGAIWLVRAQP